MLFVWDSPVPRGRENGMDEGDKVTPRRRFRFCSQRRSQSTKVTLAEAPGSLWRSWRQEVPDVEGQKGAPSFGSAGAARKKSTEGPRLPLGVSTQGPVEGRGVSVRQEVKVASCPLLFRCSGPSGNENTAVTFSHPSGRPPTLRRSRHPHLAPSERGQVPALHGGHSWPLLEEA